jgi:hypothetical protein
MSKANGKPALFLALDRCRLREELDGLGGTRAEVAILIDGARRAGNS